MRRIPWQLVAAVALIVVLSTLAILQYRWLGDVSQAERDRMQASLRARASDLAQEFNAELTRMYVGLHADGERLDADPAAALAEAYDRWRSSATHPDLVHAIYLVDGRGDASAAPQRFDLSRHVLEPGEWPPDLRAMLIHAREGIPAVPGLPSPMVMADAVNARIPGLIIVVPRFTRTTTGGQTMVVADPTAFARAIVVVLDRDRLVHEVVEPLVAKHFGDPAGSDYAVSIVRRDDPAATVFSSITPPVDRAAADVTAGLFDLRMDELSSMAQGRANVMLRPGITERMTFTIVRRGAAPDAKHVGTSGGDEQGGWLLRARHRSGSLDALVAASRRRNLAISLGVLLVLGASVLLVMASAQRQQRLARQQMEFVAGVSHELRTPLAVICSAGENLADGVVAEASQVKQYGSLIETEGRRLADMVERVMEFAGISSGARPRAHAAVDVSAAIADAVRGLDAGARDRGVTIAVHANGTLPTVAGDSDALRSAIQNVVGNAVKYSPGGSTVEVTAAGAGSTVQIRVADRGLGIDRDDLPHVFKPFYRGKRAVDAQVRGAGVGLSVVRHIVDAHRGQVNIDSAPGEGTTVTIDLPVGRVLSDPAQNGSDIANGGSKRTRPTITT